MAVVQIAALDDSSTEWGENTFPNSGHQRTDAATRIARFFEKIPTTKHVPQTATSPGPVSLTQQGSVLDDLQRTPEDLIDWLTYGTDVRSPELPVLREAFEQLFAARGSERDRLVHRLLSVTAAESVMQAAFAQFKERGNAERLVLASALLEGYGRAAVRPLRKMARARLPECEYFVDTLANLAEDASLFESMADLLHIWSEHPVRDVRLRLVDIGEALPSALRNGLLNALADDRDEEVSEAAREYLQSHA